ncbi:MAG TPA: helix-turn-helix transcriptional regulator [Dermatophilaceae bacterium]|nr:helix-turn-helix transcriptional regulator [Dermatophilaceae bacterium]
MTTRVSFYWNLRQVMAENGIFQTTDLVAPLAERGIHLSRQMIHRVVTKTPQRINVELLAALCDILNCNAGDLLQLRREHVRDLPIAVNDNGPGIGDLKPVRATIRRPHE